MRTLNVQGDRTMGIHERPAQKLLDSLARVFKRPMPQAAGFDVVTGAKALIEGKLKVLWVWAVTMPWQP